MNSEYFGKMRVVLFTCMALLAFFVSGCGEPSDPEKRTAESLTKLADGIYTADLIYDDTDNTWSSQEEEYQPLVGVMKRECTKSTEIKGTYILATDDRIIFIGGINAEDLSGRKVDAFTTYEIGSITKMFTATAIFQLCEQGKLSLDDTLDKFFPEFEYGKGITVYQLLHMQSGLRKDFVTEETFLLENGERDYEEWKRYFYDGFTDDELLNMVFDDELLFEPGTQYLYSNVGYSLLAMIMEKITGQSYGVYVQKNIFDVCGMEHTSSMKTGDVTSVPEYVPGDDASDEDPYQYVDTLYMQLIKPERGVGDIHSCAYDLLLFDRALIGGKLIGGDSLAEMFRMDNGYGCSTVRRHIRLTGYTGTAEKPGSTKDTMYIAKQRNTVIYILYSFTRRQPAMNIRSNAYRMSSHSWSDQ
ncbi:MAG: beta-lactamase family protein [Lachnospiraceae bacterium]|nr:beta-lactamase family protein [Lachnospiraceae bacterium]